MPATLAFLAIFVALNPNFRHRSVWLIPPSLLCGGFCFFFLASLPSNSMIRCAWRLLSSSALYKASL